MIWSDKERDMIKKKKKKKEICQNIPALHTTVDVPFTN
jgi:hypothetical protein